jgi:hypothetical protein
VGVLESMSLAVGKVELRNLLRLEIVVLHRSSINARISDLAIVWIKVESMQVARLPRERPVSVTVTKRQSVMDYGYL